MATVLTIHSVRKNGGYLNQSNLNGKCTIRCHSDCSNVLAILSAVQGRIYCKSYRNDEKQSFVAEVYLKCGTCFLA